MLWARKFSCGKFGLSRPKQPFPHFRSSGSSHRPDKDGGARLLPPPLQSSTRAPTGLFRVGLESLYFSYGFIYWSCPATPTKGGSAAQGASPFYYWYVQLMGFTNQPKTGANPVIFRVHALTNHHFSFYISICMYIYIYIYIYIIRMYV